MRIAWFTPFGRKSAIGHYSEEIVRELAREDEVTVFAPAGKPGDPPRAAPVPVEVLPPAPTADLLDRLGGFDLRVYNFGNYLDYHLPIYEAAVRRPGIAVLHDLVMWDFFLAYFLTHRRDPAGFARYMGFAHGPEAEAIARDVVAGRRVPGMNDPARLQYPLFRPALHRALGVVVHSEYARNRVEDSAVPVQALDFPLFGPTAALAAAPRSRPARGDRVRVLTFGVVNPNKLVHATIEAIGRSPLLRGAVEFRVIGQAGPEYDRLLRGLVAEHRLDGVVQLTGWGSDDELREALVATDVVVNLRNPHTGESSASLLDSLVAGVPTVVWDHGFYAEFPDDVVVKIGSEADLGPALERLARDPVLRRQMGGAARDHALSRFDTGRYCDRFRHFADQVRQRTPLIALTDRVSDLLLELGSSAVDGLADRFAAELAVLAGPDGVPAAARPPAGELDQPPVPRLSIYRAADRTRSGLPRVMAAGPGGTRPGQFIASRAG